MSGALCVFVKIMRALFGWSLPQDCFVCGRVAGFQPVCQACRASLPRLHVQRCSVCALPVRGDGGCGRCLKAKPAFDATFVAFDYAFPVDALLQAFKYQHQLGLAAFFAENLAAQNLPGDIDGIVPVPLHPRRLQARGFNQTLEIARPFSRLTGCRLVYDRVRRVRDTPAQAGLTRKARARNLKGAFAYEGCLKGARILIVDDVMTTGATLNALAGELKRQGAVWVGNAVVARTPFSGKT